MRPWMRQRQLRARGNISAESNQVEIQATRFVQDLLGFAAKLLFQREHFGE
jgi:hypothetical protein